MVLESLRNNQILDIILNDNTYEILVSFKKSYLQKINTVALIKSDDYK